jgi:hypothetical protein
METKSLPAFGYDWVGGDIRGLRALNGQCRQVASQINDADRALTQQVASLVIAIGTGSAVAVGAGVVASTAAAVGVGDFVHHLIQENWAVDWHQHGLLDGTVHGVADSFDQTRHDVAHWLDDLNPF